MNKRISAAAAALLMSVSMLTACGDGNSALEETTINVIDNGTSAVEGESASGDGAGENSGFVDPADIMGVTGTEPAQGDAAETYETTLPDNHQDIIDMLESGAVTTTAAPVLTDYSVDCKDRYGYNQLNDQEKALYEAILEAAKNMKLRVSVDDSVTDEMWVKAYGMVYMQEPQLFWLSSNKLSKGKVWYWETDTDTIASMQAEIDAEVSKILSAVNGKSTFEKLEYFHDYLCLNNEFGQDSGHNETIYGAFSSMHALQCAGYAKAMQYLCDMAGIESMVVVGTTDAGRSHAWNVVKVEGDWYNLDTTWGDPVISNPDPTYCRHRYFLVPDSWIHNKSHFNINQKTTGTQVTYFTPPSCTAEAYNYFAQKGLLFSDKASADAAIKEAMKTAAASKKRAAEIRVSSKELYDEMVADLKTYASWIKNENSDVKSVSNNCDESTLVIQLDLIYN